MEIGKDLQEFRDVGISLPIVINLRKSPHLLLTGRSGSGKTQAGAYYMAKAMASAESYFFISDYKADCQYRHLQGSFNYSTDEEAVQIIEDYYSLFTAIRENHVYPDSTTHYTLLVEEYFGLLNYVEIKCGKKAKADLMGKIAELLAVARSFQFGVWISVQRAAAELFASGARDNLQTIIALGRIGKETRSMLFSGEVLPEKTNYSAGQGLVLTDGQCAVREIFVPYIQAQDKMMTQIRRVLDRQPTLTDLFAAVAKGQSEE